MKGGKDLWVSLLRKMTLSYDGQQHKRAMMASVFSTAQDMNSEY